MKYRKQRIAWSVGWVLACALLIVFWVRSNTYWDSPYGPLGQHHDFQLNSLKGHLFLGIGKPSSGKIATWKWRQFRVTSLTETGATGTAAWPFTWKINVLGVGFIKSNIQHHIVMPYWLLS